jgi:membrane-associated protein
MLDFLTACAHLNPVDIIKTGSYLGIAVVVFAESGLLIGIFFPGDSLLFASGLLAGAGVLAFFPLVLFVVVAAIAGDSVGYWFGKNVGTNFFNRKDSLIFKQEYLKRTQTFYKKYGGRAVILARFVPIVRTLAPILAGVGGMKYGTFLSFNMLGGALWGAGMLARLRPPQQRALHHPHLDSDYRRLLLTYLPQRRAWQTRHLKRRRRAPPLFRVCMGPTSCRLTRLLVIEPAWLLSKPFDPAEVKYGVNECRVIVPI